MKVRARLLSVWLFGAAALLLSAGPVLAQLGIAIESDVEKFVRYEPVRLRITLRNYSGNTLLFGGEGRDRGQLSFIIDTHSGNMVRALQPGTALVKDLILGAGETRQLSVAINTLYDMQREDTYTICAQVGHARLANDFRSNALVVEVSDGTEVWSREMGQPVGATAGHIPSRRVTLLLFHDRTGDIYCLRIEDAEMVYGLVRLGSRISGAEPECDIDGASNVHVLFQTQSRLCAYRVYDYNVQLKQEKYYVADNTIPHLVRDPDIGRISVAGGRLGVEGVDFDLNPEASGQTRGTAGETSSSVLSPAAPKMPVSAVPGAAAESPTKATKKPKSSGGGFFGLFKRTKQP